MDWIGEIEIGEERRGGMRSMRGSGYEEEGTTATG